jgi:DNA polymerase III epsilon subunit-like protein
MQQDLLRFQNKQKYAVIDCEACSLNLVHKNNLAWQWAILDCEGDKVINQHNLYVKWPHIPISEEAAKVTHFDQNKINQLGIDPKLVLEIVDKYIYNPEYKLLIHNGLGYDVYLHNIFRNNLGYKTDYSYIDRVIDTHALAKGIKLDIKYDNKDDFTTYQYSLLNIKSKGLKTNLTILGKENDIQFDYDNLHDGIKDVELLFLIWNKWIKWQIDI